MFCPDCGSEVAEGRKFCGKCGGQIHAAAGSVDITPGSVPQETAVLDPRRPTSPRQMLIYALVALLVVLGGVGWWWFHRPVPAYRVQDPGIYPYQVQTAEGKPGKWGFIDADGKVLIQPEWDGVAWGGAMGGLLAFSEGLCGVQKDGKWGYVDVSGHLVIPNQFDAAGPFQEGLARVNLGNQAGFIDKVGRYVINPQFDNAADFHDGLAPVRAEGGWGFINKSGAYVVKPQFQGLVANGFSDGLTPICQGKCGFIDHNGIFVIKTQFDGVSPFSEGLASVRLNNKWGYINTAGEFVINPQFDLASAFSGGLAAVQLSGRQGTVGKDGKYVLNPGQYKIQLAEDDLLRVNSSDGAGLLTRDGKWVVKPSKAVTGIGGIFGKVFYGVIGGQLVPISMSGKVLAGWYKGAMLDSLAQDIENQQNAYRSMGVLNGAEASYTNAYPANGFTASLNKLGPANGSPDENHAGLIDAALATGTKDNYQFAIATPAGGATGGPNSSYFIVAKPLAGHGGPTFCTDGSGTIHFTVQPEECTLTSPIMGD